MAPQVLAQTAAQLGERLAGPSEAEELRHRPGDRRSMARQVQSHLGDLVLAVVVQQQVASELADLGAGQPGRRRSRLAVKQPAVDDEVRVRSADVRAPREGRTAIYQWLRQGSEGREHGLREFHLRGDVSYCVGGNRLGQRSEVRARGYALQHAVLRDLSCPV